MLYQKIKTERELGQINMVIFFLKIDGFTGQTNLFLHKREKKKYFGRIFLWKKF